MRRLFGVILVVVGVAGFGCDSGGDGGGGGEDTAIGGEDTMSVEDTVEPAGDAIPGADVLVPEDTAPPEDTPKVVDPKCAALVANWNSGFDVFGEHRSFVLELPEGIDDGGPWPVVFNWHGFGDSAANMHNLMKPYVNQHSFKFILVTPEDTDPLMGDGLDWMIVNVDENNKEARLFDELLECIDQRWGVDWDHVHSVGFSAGAVATDMIGVTRGDVLASVVSFSGVYFSNPENDIAMTNWMDMTHTNTYPQLVMHGGTPDTWGVPPFIEIKFNECAARDRTWLNARGHDVVFCEHTLGHTIPMDFGGLQAAEFFKDHPKGAASPYMAGLPDNFTKYCVPSPGN
jgi:predicted esterase